MKSTLVDEIAYAMKSADADGEKGKGAGSFGILIFGNGRKYCQKFGLALLR